MTPKGDPSSPPLRRVSVVSLAMLLAIRLDALLDRGYGKPPQHITGEVGPSYVVRLPEPCKTAEEWVASLGDLSVQKSLAVVHNKEPLVDSYADRSERRFCQRGERDMDDKDQDQGATDTAIGTAGSTLGGAAAGAVAGTALGVPVIGTVIGALSGAAIGAARKRTKTPTRKAKSAAAPAKKKTSTTRRSTKTKTKPATARKATKKTAAKKPRRKAQATSTARRSATKGRRRSSRRSR